MGRLARLGRVACARYSGGMDPKSHDEVTAYHEAGHAVVALALGRVIHKVSVLPNRERLGECRFGKGTSKPTDDWVEREILIALGGMAAEARHTGTYATAEAAQDLRFVRRLAQERKSDRQVERYEQRMLDKVEYMLADDGHWRAVVSIAAELMKHGTISGRAARHLFEIATREE
ncbi:Cell division-associated, ATP-dependent zinc metalloprotease FtsH [Frigoriglobus tundricola]|uniref:Cell division-associated, ATP-dependent zinc metalloprotease FtsH n=2 Tax=Frigoriglobus tundricola TaxID=2774151 RepID=A0A6M5YHJ9_9BACT|nr:Cell division-associated, ATP-dependent zinc metalloprotease FtsH [Frigoriglobus tundricola]